MCQHSFHMYWFVLNTATSTPSKKKLLEFIPRMAPHWYEIGLQLLNDNQEPHLDVIKLNCSNDYIQCCLKMLWYWLETNPKASWQQLTNSLRSPVLQLNTVAASIEAMFTGTYIASSYYVYVICNY